MKIYEFLEKKAEKVPGLGYVATALSFAAAVLLRNSGENSPIWFMALVWLYAVFFYILGGVLDPIFYDPWFSLAPDASERLKFGWYRMMQRANVYSVTLNQTRTRAARKLNDAAKGAVEIPDPDCERGIYKTAKNLFLKSDAWDNRVKFWLETSKAARAFVIPFTIVAACDIVRWLCFPGTTIRSSPWKMLMSWPSASLLALATFLLYLWLRVIPSVRLFQLVLDHDIFIISAECFEGKDGGATVKRNLISAGSAVFRCDTVPLFRRDDASSKKGHLWFRILAGAVVAGIAIFAIWPLTT
jgi:hypothetical protein